MDKMFYGVFCVIYKLHRGTFGLWASVLSGRTRILPKHFQPQMKGKPFDLRNQVPIFDLSHNWMSEDIRARYTFKYLENQAIILGYYNLHVQSERTVSRVSDKPSHQ